MMVYLATMPRGLVWGDGIELVSVASTLGIAHPTGYPLFTLLGYVFSNIPFGTAYWRVALFCMLSMVGKLFFVLSPFAEANRRAGFFFEGFALSCKWFGL